MNSLPQGILLAYADEARTALPYRQVEAAPTGFVSALYIPCGILLAYADEARTALPYRQVEAAAIGFVSAFYIPCGSEFIREDGGMFNILTA
jgi:hypothetical protein